MKPSRAAEKPAADRRKNAAHSLPRASRGGASRGSAPKRERQPAPKGRKNQTPVSSLSDLRIIAIPLTDDERAAVNDGQEALDKLLEIGRSHV